MSKKVNLLNIWLKQAVQKQQQPHRASSQRFGVNLAIFCTGLSNLLRGLTPSQTPTQNKVVVNKKTYVSPMATIIILMQLMTLLGV